MIRANGGTAVGYKVDISKKEEVYKAADALRRDVGDVSTYSFFVFIHKHFVKTIKMNVECWSSIFINGILNSFDKILNFVSRAQQICLRLEFIAGNYYY